MSIKKAIKRIAPWLTRPYSYMLWNLSIRPQMRRIGMVGVFDKIYRENGWGCGESVSGEGATLRQTAAIRNALPRLVGEFQVRSMMDIPCGDFSWMRFVELPVQYIGADIVDDLVTYNCRTYATGARSFVKCDLSRDPIPLVDLILCRDCLVHFSFVDIKSALANIKRSGSRFLLTTTHCALTKNVDIVTGEWRRLNLELPPFSLPAPIALVDERCPNPAAPDKHLGLWRIQDLDVEV